jgi:hypothetical protein
MFFVIKFVLNIFRNKSQIKSQQTNTGENKEQSNIDKSKIVDADFEEIK